MDDVPRWFPSPWQAMVASHLGKMEVNLRFSIFKESEQGSLDLN
jgi:hypothetical protein